MTLPTGVASTTLAPTCAGAHLSAHRPRGTPLSSAGWGSPKRRHDLATAAEQIAEDAARFDAEPSEQRVLLEHATWDDYQRLDELRGASAVPRLTFLHGALELMTPGRPHEADKMKSTPSSGPRWQIHPA